MSQESNNTSIPKPSGPNPGQRTSRGACDILLLYTSHSNTSNNKTRKEHKSGSVNNEVDSSRCAPSTGTSNDIGSSYLQTWSVPGIDRRLVPHITCFHCDRKGHYADNCLSNNMCKTVNDEQHIQTDNPTESPGMSICTVSLSCSIREDFFLATAGIFPLKTNYSWYF